MSDTIKAIFLSLFGFALFSMGDIMRKYVLLEYSPIDVQVWATSFAVLGLVICAKTMGGFAIKRSGASFGLGFITVIPSIGRASPLFAGGTGPTKCQKLTLLKTPPVGDDGRLAK